MNDLSIKVMIGAAWAFAVLNVAPDVVAVLIERGALPILPGLAANWTEFVYVLALALLGPVMLWVMTARKRAAGWREFERKI